MYRLAIAIFIGCAGSAIAQTADEPIPPNRITVHMRPGITSSAQLPTQELINARKALTQGRSIYISQMRQLADMGDGYAASKFGEWLDARPETSQLSDIAHYYGIAAATGRSGGIGKLIRTLDRMEPSDLLRARSDVLENIVFTYARAGNSTAVDAVIRYQASRKPFGRIDMELENLLAESQGEGAAQISLHLAMQILQSPEPTVDDLQRAEGYLQIASTTTSLETHLVATNLTPLLDAALAQQPIVPVESSQ